MSFGLAIDFLVKGREMSLNVKYFQKNNDCSVFFQYFALKLSNIQYFLSKIVKINLIISSFKVICRLGSKSF